MTERTVYFFLGTEAELIKIFPIIVSLKNRGVRTKIVASGQNDITKSRVLKELNGGKVDILISDVSIKQTPIGLLLWFFKTYAKTRKALKNEFSGRDNSKSIFVVHGDTISTIMGARIAKKLGVRVAHAEAGLRSFNYFSPFPEEIDRIITSWYADIHFAPCQEGIDNLKNKPGLKVNTYTNPVYDSYIYSKSVPLHNESLKAILEKKYFIFVVHRNENLADKNLMSKMIDKVNKISTAEMECVFIIHGPTQQALEDLGLFTEIEKNKNIHLTPRLDYFDFMKVAEKAAFVVTDGGSNQQEFYFTGTPCILMRTATEQPEGIGENIVLSKNDFAVFDDFVNNFESFRRNPFVPKTSPTDIITETLVNELK